MGVWDKFLYEQAQAELEEDATPKSLIEEVFSVNIYFFIKLFAFFYFLPFIIYFLPFTFFL